MIKTLQSFTLYIPYLAALPHILLLFFLLTVLAFFLFLQEYTRHICASDASGNLFLPDIYIMNVKKQTGTLIIEIGSGIK